MTFDDPKHQRRTIIEQGTSFRGSLSSTCPIDVHGSIEGDVDTPVLAVSASGRVHGRARVGSVHSDGELSGEFDAESVELAGQVRDNTVIRARSLHVKLASERGKLQVIFGECELAIGDEPAERVQATSTTQAAVALESPSSAIVDEVPAPAIEAPAPALAEPANAASDAPLSRDIGETPPAVLIESSGIIAGDTRSSAMPSGDSASNDGPAKPRNGQRERRNGWSHPPSQPPPSS